MGNVLEFSLGLATGAFVGRIDEATAKLKGFIGGLVSLEAVSEGVMSAIEKGAGLEKLSKRTGESVSSLYELQAGFKAAGLSAEDVGATISHMQRSLGGINEMGERTPDIFRRLGLNIDELKKQNAPQQLSAIVGAMARLNPSGQMAAASSIFGRADAGNIAALTRSTGEMAEGMQKAMKEAEKWQRVSGSFERIEIAMNHVKELGMTFFSGIAEHLAPALEDALDALDDMSDTLSHLGAMAGKFGSALIEAFREGKLGDLIGLSLQVGFDSFMVILPGLFEKIGAMMLKMFETPLIYLQAGMEYALEAGAHTFANSKTLQFILKSLDPTGGLIASYGINKAKELDSGPASFKDILADRKKEGVQFDLGTGQFGIKDIDSDANDRLSKAKDKIGQIAAPLGAMIDGLDAAAQARPHRQHPAHTVTPGTEDFQAATKGGYKTEGNALEKMGFVMGGPNPMVDYARRTAHGVEQLVTKFSMSSLSSMSLSAMSHADLQNAV